MAGNILSTYYKDADGNFRRNEAPVSGGSRIGVYFDHSDLSSSGNDKGRYVYEVSDHLGNVRATISRDENDELKMASKRDYYPYGLAMNGRTRYSSDRYRFGYQGQFSEYDEETGWHAFELRHYSAEIGRWLSMDPKRQFASPYVGMGNNPVRLTDSTGGYAVVDDFLFGFIGGLFQSRQNFSDPSASRLGNAFNNGLRLANNSIEIWESFVRIDKSISNIENLGQIISRFTWELPNTLAGVFVGHLLGYFNGIKSIDNYHGATVITTNDFSKPWGFTVGSVISLSQLQAGG